MSKPKTVFRCAECGGSAPKWVGRCPSCQGWNTLVEELEVELVHAGASSWPGEHPSVGARDVPVPIAEVTLDEWHARPTGIGEVDRVLGGGLVPGSVTLVGGEPGVGKSTLLLQVLGALAGRGLSCLYISAEESKQQVRLRADRLGSLRPKLFLACETALPHILGHVAELEPDVLVVDSIQTVFHPELGSAPGTVAQVRECAARLVHEAKARDLIVVLVGHVTKDGGLAGPRVLEHLVDTVLAFQGERHHALRLLRADKHRFGPTNELGLFEMTDEGLAGVPDPSVLFLADRRSGVAGSVVVPTMEGFRPLLVELQALLVSTNLPTARRTAQGIDSGRLATVLAVLSQQLEVRYAGFDVHTLAVGGVKVNEPAADLGLALALVSSHRQVPLPADLVACGEVGLGGELRQVSQLERRLHEAARLGFGRAVVPWHAPDGPDGMTLLRAQTVHDALRFAGLHRSGGGRRAAPEAMGATGVSGRDAPAQHGDRSPPQGWLHAVERNDPYEPPPGEPDPFPS